MNRKQRAEIATETLQIINNARYENQKGESINIGDRLYLAKSQSKHYKPEMFDGIFLAVEQIINAKDSNKETQFEIVNETTLSAAKRLIVWSGKEDTVCLNFASAKNPGGGFINGSNAQEESLARSSGLYPCISQMQEMYRANKSFGSSLYTDNMIYSPRVPVFRDDRGILLDFPYLLSIITSPAVNAGAAISKEKINREIIENVMLERTKKVLSLAVINNHKNIILGAWGCGVFQNSPRAIARIFHKHLVASSSFHGWFDKVVFAILDTSQNKHIIQHFREKF